ncbi:unnamed protein product [Symbiodinium sp. CCMP2592]|nr:unnamed protein product [Symbiodinium sp. CCMP2592]
MMSAFNIPPDQVHELHAHVRQTALVQEAGASPWASSLLQEFQSSTWFSIRGHLAEVKAGTRPGDSLADIVFSFLFAAVLKRLRQALLDAGLSVFLPWDPSWEGNLDGPSSSPNDSLAPLDVSWMDDLVILLWSDSPSQLVEDVKFAAETLLDQCVKALLHPNLSPGKTEAVLSLIGPGSRGLRSRLFRNPQPGIPLQPALHPPATLRLVPRYKHLGGVLHWQGHLSHELKSRIGQAWQAFRKHRRAVFYSPLVTHREKSLLFQSVVASTLFYGAGTWVCDDTSSLDPLRGALLAMGRQMLRPTFDREQSQHVGAGRVLAIARLSTVDAEIHAARLRHLSTVLRQAPAEFWAILHHDSQWFHLLRESLSWLRASFSRAAFPVDDLEEWTRTACVIRDKPQTWKRWISRALHLDRLTALWDAEVAHYHGLFLRFLLTHGAHPASDVLTCEQAQELCALCGKSFPNLRAWSHHAFKCHGRVREERLYASGNRCNICLRLFASNFRLCNHLQHSKSCFAALLAAGDPGEPQPGRGSRKYNSGAEQPCPAVTAAGPVLARQEVTYVPEAERPDPATLSALEMIYAFPEEWPCFQDLLEAVRAAFCKTCLQVSRLKATAAQWWNNLHEELDRCDDVPVAWAAQHLRIARMLLQVDFVTWLAPTPTAHGPQLSTFRDAAKVLPWLVFDLVQFPSPQPSSEDTHWICARSPPRPSSVVEIWDFVSHDSCFADPGLLDFDAWCRSRNGCVRGFSLIGLLPSLQCPPATRSYKSLQEPLQQLRLFADIVRGLVLLWSAGRPAFVIAPSIACGQLVFVEHVLADSAKMPFLLAAQVALRPVQMALCNGCDPCRDTERLFESELFEAVKLKRFSLPVLGVPIPHIKGIALKSEGDLTKTWPGPLSVEEFI